MTAFVHKHAGWIVEGITVLLCLFVIISGASADRPVGDSFAQRGANNFVRYNYCGGGGWRCAAVFVPLVHCGYHTYCWNGVSHRETFLWWTRLRRSSGTVNGHTGKVTGYGER